jgi:serine/threonine protein kinase
MGTSGPTSNQGPLSGQRLGDKYLLGALLGQGGFGVVYQAQHILLNRPQAIKILLEQHFTNPKFRERFLREARTLAALDHPNIVHVDDFGLEGTHAFLVMPYIGGGTLQGTLKARRGPLGLNEVWRALEQICAALDYAHARHVVHLDLKPLNLLLHEDRRLLLTDFGLAHLMEQGAVEGGTSLAFGTPSYMSPEHFDGQPGQQSDVYALGVILYQMLTGRLPFEGSTPRAILLKVLAEAPPPLGSVRPDLPPGLEGVVNKALAKQIAGRYQTAGELLADFKAAMAGRQTQAFSSDASIANAPTRLTPQPPHNSTIWTASPPGAPPDTTIRASNPPGAPVPLPPTIRAVNPPIEPGELSMQLPPAITPDKSPAPGATPAGASSDQILKELEELKAAMRQLVQQNPQQAAALSAQGIAPPASSAPAGAKSARQGLKRVKVWTPGFSILFSFAFIIAGLLTALSVGILKDRFFISLCLPIIDSYNCVIGTGYLEQGGLVISTLAVGFLGLICLAGFFVTRSKLMRRAVLPLQLLSAMSAAIWLYGGSEALTSQGSSGFPIDVISLYTIPIFFLEHLSLLLLSYRIAPWRFSWKTGFGLIPIIIGILVPALLLLLRPSGWRWHPETIFLLIGGEVFLSSYFGRYGLVLGPFILSNFLYALAFLLIVQSERVMKNEQRKAALAGQKP